MRRPMLRPASLFVTALLFCCGPLPPLPDDAGTPAAVVSESAAPPARPGLCALPIATTAHEARVNYVLPSSDAAWMRVWTTGLFDDGTLVARYERRDLRGQELGQTLYRCDASGLWLVQSEGNGVRLQFEPPLPVWSVAMPSADQGGEVTVLDPDGTRTMRYGYSFVGTNSAPPSAFANLLGLWHRQQFALLIEDASTSWTWEGSSVWGVLDGAVFPADRRVERSINGAVVQEREEARTLHPFTP